MFFGVSEIVEVLTEERRGRLAVFDVWPTTFGRRWYFFNKKGLAKMANPL